MNKMMMAIKKSWQIFKQDKLIWPLASAPLVIGVAFYGAFGTWMYGPLLKSGHEWIEGHLQQNTWGPILYYVLAAFMTIVLLMIVNWTFFLIVSLVASPFNDLISSRVEKNILGKSPEEGGNFKTLVKKLWRTLFNEFKKIILILIFSVLSILVGFIFPPLSVLISGLLFAASFLDYSWSRHDYNVGQCLKSVTSSFVIHLLSGMGLLFLISVPIVNLFVMPFSTIFYTVLFSENKLLENKTGTH